MKILNTLFLPVLLASLTVSQAFAEADPEKDLLKYDVEIILFEDAHARYINSESWNFGNSFDGRLSNSKSNVASYQNIKPAILRKEYNRLKKSSEYSILFYGAWRQTGLEKSKSFEINIEDLKNRHKVSSQNSLSGSFKLVLARYLHIYNTLRYQRRTATAETYPVNSHRRMRSKELHYIDHPLVGMLIQINPVVKPKKEVAQ